MKFWTVQFVGSTGFFAGLIRLKGASPFNHCSFVMDDGSLLDAQAFPCGGKPSGVQIRPPGYDNWFAISRIAIPVDDEQYARGLAFLMEQVGKPYDWSSIGGFVFGRDWRDPSSWICSELQIAAVEKMGVFTHPLETAASHIDPGTGFAVLSPWGATKKLKGP